jgi:hypothetical protein
MQLLNGGGNAFGIHFRECEFMKHLNPIYRSPNIRKVIIELLNGENSVIIDDSRLNEPFDVSSKKKAKKLAHTAEY